MQICGRNHWCIWLIVVSFLAISPSLTWAQEQYEGKWEVYKVVIDGRKQKPEPESNPIVVIEKGKFTLTPGPERDSRVYTVELDSDADPMTINMTAQTAPFGDKLNKGIYKLEEITINFPARDEKGNIVLKDRRVDLLNEQRKAMIICIPTRVDSDRPKKFESKPGSGTILITLIRPKKD